MSNSLETLTVEAFQPRVGERFRIRPNSDTDIYEVVHDELGSVQIFLVPIGPDAEGMVYEAIFT